MMRTALTMLVGDRSKFLGIVFGLAFGTLLMVQQGAVFRGVMVLVYGHVTDTPQVELWITDPGMPELDRSEPLNERYLDAVRAVDGVHWAVPLSRRQVMLRLSDGEVGSAVVMGIDDATLIGAPSVDKMVAGSVQDLRRPDTIIVDQHSASTHLATIRPDGSRQPLSVGDSLQIAGRRMTVVGLCRSTLNLVLLPTIYMLRSHLSAIDINTDRAFNIILAGVGPGQDPEVACRRIAATTGLAARTSAAISRHVYDYYLYRTGIPANFAIAVLLGFVVGAAIAGQTFNQYVHDNRRIFAALKAMGMRDGRLVGMLLYQALFAALIGYGLGVGAATAFGAMLAGTDLSYRLEPELLAIVLAAVLMISLSAAAICARNLLRLDPAQVFRS
ncbi:MAG: FtsX-like permease family protein [Planctomycetes bacterium]|nr:FtsX-like permease family protein [Planctomycetota bacterium]